MKRARASGRDFRKLPTEWLFTDTRLGGQNPTDRLWRAVLALPRGGGIVFRHYDLPKDERRQLMNRLAVISRRRGLFLIGAEMPTPDGMHRNSHAAKFAHCAKGIVTASAHNRREAAQRLKADIIFLSPVFPTHSHPGARALGRVKFGLIRREIAAKAGRAPKVMALGGMDRKRARSMAPLGCDGFAAIDYWAR